MLAKRRVAVIVGKTVFVHGGILPEHVAYDLGRLNTEVSRWMRGELAELPAEAGGPRAPVWIRDYGEPMPDAAACGALANALSLLDSVRMVIGHTVQEKGMSSACDGKVWRIDVGLSGYYGDHATQVLEIAGDRITPLAEARSKSAPSSAGQVPAAP
jgi:hypothetical protein